MTVITGINAKLMAYTGSSHTYDNYAPTAGTPDTPSSDTTAGDWVKIFELTQWQITIQADQYDASAIGDLWKKSIAGMRGWSGTMQAHWDIGSTSTSNQTLIQNMVLGTANVTSFGYQTPMYFKFYVDNKRWYGGWVYVQQGQTGAATTNTVNIQFNFSGTKDCEFGTDA